MRENRIQARIAKAAGYALATCLLTLLGIAGWAYAESELLNLRNPVPGRSYVVDGRKMHLYCSGAGSPTVLIEAGLRNDWLGWQAVQPQLSKVTQVCTYDRAGLGHSESRSDTQDAEAVARHLHLLLAAGQVQRPLLLVGHSAGGFFVREYAREFPGDVAGVVLVDSSSPEQLNELPGFKQSFEENLRSARHNLWHDRFRVWSGWERLSGHCKTTPGKGLASLQGQYDAQACRPAYVDTDLRELMGLETSAAEAARLTSFGNVPLLVISRDTISPAAEASSALENPVWSKEQENLTRLSPLSWEVVAKGSGHRVDQDRPDLVVREITRLIVYLRGGPAPPFGTRSVQ